MSQCALPAVRACLFDVDGLLINSEDIYFGIYNDILRSYNKPPLSWSVVARQQSRGTVGALRIIEWTQIPISLEEFEARVTAEDERFRKSELLSGVQELLHNLSHRTTSPVYMGLASSADKSLFDIKTSHIDCISSSFSEPFRVFGDDTDMNGKEKKPAPDIFLLVLERINSTLGERREDAIKPRECLVFEDSIAGVEAARRAGMRVVWVPHPGLLSVCGGWMDDVLQGTTERGGEEIGPMVPKSGSLHEQESWDCVWKLEDGWAECIASLSHFRYEKYGIHLDP